MDDTASQEERQEEDDEEYEEVGGGNQLLGFMFGNVDNSGDLDVDYLDEDAKEHLSALADKLGHSLTNMDLIKSSPATTDASEQYFDEKAEDAIDYEDIDEQYDGPETQAVTEEEHLLPKREYLSSDAMLSSLNCKSSIFDEDDYDEDEEAGKERKIKENSDEFESLSLRGGDNVVSVKQIFVEGVMLSDGSLESEEGLEPTNFEVDQLVPEEQLNPKSETCLPILFIEDGKEILKFSEIFGIHEPFKKADRRHCQKHPSCNELDKSLDISDIAEEDEAAYLRSSDHDLSITRKLSLAVHDWEEDSDEGTHYLDVQNKDICLGSLPMKDNTHMDASAFSLLSPNLYSCDYQNWEDEIIWGNSPQLKCNVPGNVSYSEHDTESQSEENLDDGCCSAFISNEKDEVFFGYADLADSLGSVEIAISTYQQSSERESRRQLIGSDSFSRRLSFNPKEAKNENTSAELSENNTLHCSNKLSIRNTDLLNGSWLDHIIWDSHETILKPKLILDLEDEEMFFEVLDHKDSDHLFSCASAMVVVRPCKHNMGESSDVHNQGMSSSARFNISNDKYYSNRKISQQAKSHTKKRASHGIKVLHSVPALRLQTMKPKLSNKDICNFHRPKAFWYPHNNEVAAKAHGTLHPNEPVKIVLMTLGGRGVKLHLDAEETLSGLKLKASKKLGFKMSENVKVFYSSRELEDDKSLTIQGVCPNSVLHLVRTRIQIWPKAQRLPGENKPLRPPGAFKKKSDLSVKDGHVFLVEYCEERPLLLGNVGMGARLCTYYQKLTANDQTASSLRNGNNGLGTVLTLDPTDRSPFLGDIVPGCSQSSLETNMYRSPVFLHKLPPTDYLLVRSAKGVLSLRRIDKLYSAGQQEPHMEVLSPGSKSVQSYLVNRMLVYVYREFRAKEKPGMIPFVRADELAAIFPGLTDAFMRKRLKLCAELKKGAWVKRNDFRIPSEEELRRTLAPENVVSYESMQAGLYRLKHIGISRLTHPVGLSSAMNQLPDEAITLAAASHIERELQITSWNLTSNFVACTNQDRENIERLEITGVGDPSGRGLGFSYVRATPKAPITSAVVKKKVVPSKGGSSVTGTDADLRRLSMDAAREVLLKFKVPEEQIDKLTRWHRIALVRKLSSEQAASGVKVEAMTLSKFARGQRMSFLQLQQQTREKCQEIWDRQVQSLSAAYGDENDSDSEANSDLDSFAGDLENLLDAEEFEEEIGNTDTTVEKTDVTRGLKMRRCHSFAQTEEEIEDDEEEAAFIRRLLDDDESEVDKRRKPIGTEVARPMFGSGTVYPANKMGTAFKQIISSPYPDGLYTSKEHMIEPKEVKDSPAEMNFSWKAKVKDYVNDEDLAMGLVKKKYKAAKGGSKVYKEKKHVDRRESFVCGACGQLGHMRTNKNCPKYGEDAEPSEVESALGRSRVPDGVNRPQLKILNKKAMPALSKGVAEGAPECLEKHGMGLEVKVPPLKFKCGSAERPNEMSLLAYNTFDKVVKGSMNIEANQIGKNLKIQTRMKPENVHPDTPKPTVRIVPPHGMDREPPKKIVIKQPKFMAHTHIEAVDVARDRDSRKIKKIAELTSSFGKPTKLENDLFNDEISNNRINVKRLREEEKSRNMQRVEEERTRRMIEDNCYEAAIRREELQHAKKKKTKKNNSKKPGFTDDYLNDYKSYRTDRRFPERDRSAKRSVVDTSLQDYAPSTKRRRRGEVVLSNILESIVDLLRESTEVSYLFLKPVTKKEAPDYFSVIKKPMDLSTIREKVRNMEYKRREEFRHDVWLIAYNAHKYNDCRNPGIPPLADQLLELCEFLMIQRDADLTDAEAGVESTNI